MTNNNRSEISLDTGLCQNSSVGPRIILSWPMERTLSTNG